MRLDLCLKISVKEALYYHQLLLNILCVTNFVASITVRKPRSCNKDNLIVNDVSSSSCVSFRKCEVIYADHSENIL